MNVSATNYASGIATNPIGFVSQQFGVTLARKHENVITGLGIYSFSDRQDISFLAPVGIGDNLAVLEAKNELKFNRLKLGTGAFLGFSRGKWELTARLGVFATVRQNEVFMDRQLSIQKSETSPNGQRSLSIVRYENWYEADKGFYQAISQLNVGYNLTDRFYIGLAYTKNRWLRDTKRGLLRNDNHAVGKIE